MPIKVKTMRDIWDEEKKRKKEAERVAKRVVILPDEIKKHHREYLKRKQEYLEMKKCATRAFAEIERSLGEAGFSKI